MVEPWLQDPISTSLAVSFYNSEPGGRDGSDGEVSLHKCGHGVQNSGLMGKALIWERWHVSVIPMMEKDRQRWGSLGFMASQVTW